MVVPAEIWIVVDPDGRVLGRLKSPYFSAACHFSATWWADTEVTVWPWSEASLSQREQATTFPVFDVEKSDYLLDWASRLQEKFERTRSVQ